MVFYNFQYYLNNPFDIVKIWEGGMSFHGALIGVYHRNLPILSKKKNKSFFFLDIIACVSPIGIFSVELQIL